MKVFKTPQNQMSQSKVLISNNNKIYGGNFLNDESFSWHQCPEAVRKYLNRFKITNQLTDKGTIGSDSENPAPTITSLPTFGYASGDMYRIITSGTYAGYTCEVNDLIIAINNGPRFGSSIIESDWTIVASTSDLSHFGPYSPTDYNYSYMIDYALQIYNANPDDPTANTNPYSKPVQIPNEYATIINRDEFLNNEPHVNVPFYTGIYAGTVTALDRVRWYNTTSTTTRLPGSNYQRGFNCRDLGGWACDGGTIKYGMLVRSGELNSVDKSLMVDKIGIKTEVQLLPLSEQATQYKEKSPWGIDWAGNNTNDTSLYNVAGDKTLWKKILLDIFDSVIHNKPVIFHCGIGADRTGMMAIMLEGILGVPQGDIDTDYELTNFAIGWHAISPVATTEKPIDWDTNWDDYYYSIEQYSHQYYYKLNSLGTKPTWESGKYYTRESIVTTALRARSRIDQQKIMSAAYADTHPTETANIWNVPLVGGLSNTFRNRCISFALSLGISINDINAFRNACIDGTPEEIEIIVPSYSITKTGSGIENVTFSNTTNTIEEYQTYQTNVTPSPGYLISSVQVMMGGTDITSTAFEGRTNAYTITKILSNSTINNNADTIEHGEPYNATITPDSGYLITNIQVTMGGVDKTSEVVILE